MIFQLLCGESCPFIEKHSKSIPVMSPSNTQCNTENGLAGFFQKRQRVLMALLEESMRCLLCAAGFRSSQSNDISCSSERGFGEEKRA